MFREVDPTPPARPADPVDVLCPFCLHKSGRRTFEVYLKSGKLSRMMKCPECQKEMRADSLVTDKTTLDQYVGWVVSYSYMGFFKMIHFAKWSGRLKEMGFASLFWDKYHALKPKKEPSQLDEAYD